MLGRKVEPTNWGMRMKATLFAANCRKAATIDSMQRESTQQEAVVADSDAVQTKRRVEQAVFLRSGLLKDT